MTRARFRNEPLVWIADWLNHRFWSGACKYVDMRELLKDLGGLTLAFLAAGLVMVGAIICLLGAIAFG